MRDLLQRPDLFSINTATLGYKTPLPAIIDACAARGIGAIAPWRRELQSEDLQQTARQLAASNMNVSGLCRSTYYTAPTLAERKLAIDDNRRALDDAAVLNAACYMQVVGGLPMGTKDLYEAREQVKQGIRQLLPHSKEVGVPIALEPHLRLLSQVALLYSRLYFGSFVIKIQKMLNAFLMKSATILSLGKNSILKQIRKKKRQSSISSANVISGGLASRVFSLTRHGEPLTSGYRFSSSKRCILA